MVRRGEGARWEVNVCKSTGASQCIQVNGSKTTIASQRANINNASTQKYVLHNTDWHHTLHDTLMLTRVLRRLRRRIALRYWKNELRANN